MDAAQFFEEVERQHPYSVWATKAQLMAAYSNYEANKYDDAIIGLDRFIQLHPGNRDTPPIAYYLKAQTYYEKITDVSRDQLGTERALKALREVIRRFPQSKYARDARLKNRFDARSSGRKGNVDRTFLSPEKGNISPPSNRFKRVVENYQTTTHVPEALQPRCRGLFSDRA